MEARPPSCLRPSAQGPSSLLFRSEKNKVHALPADTLRRRLVALFLILPLYSISLCFYMDSLFWLFFRDCMGVQTLP